jgi:Pyridoxamine 5'-phosphate oxidase
VSKVFEGIDAKLAAWIGAQPLFFVATAPSDAGGRVNCSPKGPIESLRILGPRSVAYLDSVGSGAETIAHLRDNGRIVIMLCAFSGPPRIVRLHGHGRVVGREDEGFAELASGFTVSSSPAEVAARRSVIVVDVDRVSDSCGFGVPVMGRPSRRPQARAWAERKLAQGGPAAIAAYMAERNAVSIDGLPALEA